jgi:hypothetical protein
MVETMSSFGEAMNSPFVVPVAGCAMILGIVISKTVLSARNRRLLSEERLSAIARGVPPPPTPEELVLTQGPRPRTSLQRQRDISRLTGIVLLSVGVGLVLFFIALTLILHVHEVLSGAAVGLLPLAVGGGFLIDARLKTREMAEATTEEAAPTQPGPPARV